MARPAPTPINCPNCGHRFGAFIEQILDVGVDPSVRNRLLSGQINNITCPSCGYQGALSTPVMYHDPEKQLAITFMPMELNVSTEERERIVGDFTNAVMRNLPEDSPKGYLLQPQQALTMQGLIDQVLEAEGITREMIDAERRKMQLVEELAEVKSTERQQLLDENADLIDRTFIDLLTLAAQAATQSDDGRRSLKLLNIRAQLLETTDAGQEIKREQEAIMEAQQELQAIGNQFTREKFVDLLLASADNPVKVDALGQMGIQALDYSTFSILTQRIDEETDPDLKHKYQHVRERLLEIGAAYEQQSRAVVDQAVNTLRQLMSAPDVAQAVRENIDRIDDTFLQVLQANLEQVRQNGNVEVSAKLKQIRDVVLQLLQDSAPPEVQFVNELLMEETDEAAIQLLHENREDIGDQFLDMMTELAVQLRAGGNDVAADRLELLASEAQKLIS